MSKILAAAAVLAVAAAGATENDVCDPMRTVPLGTAVQILR